MGCGVAQWVVRRPVYRVLVGCGLAQGGMDEPVSSSSVGRGVTQWRVVGPVVVVGELVPGSNLGRPPPWGTLR